MTFTFLFELTLLPVAVLTSVMAIAVLGSFGNDIQALSWLVWLPALTLCNSVIAIRSQDDDANMLLSVPLYDVFYGPLLTTAWVAAAVDEVSNVRMKW